MSPICSSIRSKKRGHFPQTAPGSEGWAHVKCFQRCAVAYAQNSLDPQRSVPDKLARIRAERTCSRQEKNQRLVRQRPLQPKKKNCGFTKPRVSRLAGCCIGVIGCKRYVFDHRSGCCIGDVRSRCHVFGHWCCKFVRLITIGHVEESIRRRHIVVCLSGDGTATLRREMLR